MVMKTIAACIVLASVLPAAAGGQPIPTRFDKPWPKARLEAVHLPAAAVAIECRKQSAYYYGSEANYRAHTLGCSMGGVLDNDPVCIVIYARGRLHIKRHEEAHCWGWTGRHEK
jgi:hypothetical protein